MNTTQKGNLAQSYVVAKLTELGYPVFLPFGEGDKIDLIYVKDNTPIRVQIKHARLYKDVLTFNTCTITNVGEKYVREGYTGLIDVFHVYSPHTKEVYEVPESEATAGTMTLRLTATKNNQKRSVKYAKDYILGVWC